MAASQQQASSLGIASTQNRLRALQATYFDQKFHSTFFLAPESGVEAARPQNPKSSKSSSKQHPGLRPATGTGRQLALVTKQDQPEEQGDAADDSAGFGSDVDGDQHAQHPMQLQLRRPEQDEAQMDQLYLLVESQKAAMR